ncbi:hypothetical protein [Yoonia sp. SS1-5]|uniref:Uncharacterized protein n=1 Tax=Yoonia rhodophyticola TaxID=3137370 RepID=A0AAN0MAN2_9RHOB
MHIAKDRLSIAFHVGAHKTATSHLQRSLRAASDALADQGVMYYGPDHFRLPGRSLPALFGQKATQKRAPADQLDLLRKGGHRLIISEENFMGVLNSPRRRPVKMRYPEAGRRVADIATAVDVGGLDVFLSIRNPATFLNSAYCQMLLGGRVMPFAKFARINPIESVNWHSLAKRLSRARGVNRVVVWRFEDYAPLFPRICTALAGPDAGGLIAPLARRIHVGLSATAVAEVLMQDGTGADDRVANRARKAHPVSADTPPFDGFDTHIHGLADAAYSGQIAAIRALPKVTFLDPAVTPDTVRS